MKFDDGSGDIIGVFYEVFNQLGCGFLEKVYSSSIALEFNRRGICFRKEVPLNVMYKGEFAAEYFADFVVGDIIVEVKAKKCLDSIDEAQLMNYLKATEKKIGLLVNFGGEKLEFRRKVLNL